MAGVPLYWRCMRTKDDVGVQRPRRLRRVFRAFSIIVSVVLVAVIVIAVRERGKPLESIRLVQMSADAVRFLAERAEEAAVGLGLHDAQPAFAATPDGLEWAPLKRAPISPELVARF